MKFTIFVTQQCNLRCSYCYIEKKQKTISFTTAEKVIDFIFKKSILGHEEINIGFFGGEPLLEFKLIKKITNLIYDHPFYNPDRVNLSIVSNGTIFSNEIAQFIIDNKIEFGISCDGPPFIQDKYRFTIRGGETSHLVEKNIKRALYLLPNLMVNAVYHPDTLIYLPETVKYFSSLGIKQIYLNPDFSAHWGKKDIDLLQDIYDKIGSIYTKYYLDQKPHFISLIDSKISVILQEGYNNLDRCRMGEAEFAFTTQGDIYPCERLVGNGNNDHCIGNVFDQIMPSSMSCHLAEGSDLNKECLTCSLKDYCMNWCGCSNYMTSGFYNRVSSFLCASEKAAIKTSFNVLQNLGEKLGPVFFEYLGRQSIVNSTA